LQNGLFSVLLALRNQPDKYFIVDRMELSSFTATIINYDSYLASRRPPGSEQLISGRVLEVAKRIFCNLQKVMVDSTISTVAELKEGSSYHAVYRPLPYYDSP
jgi:hypothetical protein